MPRKQQSPKSSKKATCFICGARVRRRDLIPTTYKNDRGQLFTIRSCSKCNEPPYPVGMSAAEIMAKERMANTMANETTEEKYKVGDVVDYKRQKRFIARVYGKDNYALSHPAGGIQTDISSSEFSLTKDLPDLGRKVILDPSHPHGSKKGTVVKYSQTFVGIGAEVRFDDSSGAFVFKAGDWSYL